MADYWSSFASGVLTHAADLGSDMLPVLALLAGIGLAERVVHFALRAARG